MMPDDGKKNNTEDESLQENGLHQELDKLLDGVPEDKQDEIRQVFSMTMMRQTSPQMEVMKKVTPEHITAIIDGEEKERDHSYKDRRETRIMILVLVIVGLGFMGFVIMVLRDKPEYMEKILTIVLSLIAGAGGGYGVGFVNGRHNRGN